MAMVIIVIAMDIQQIMTILFLQNDYTNSNNKSFGGHKYQEIVYFLQFYFHKDYISPILSMQKVMVFTYILSPFVQNPRECLPQEKFIIFFLIVIKKS